MAILGVLFAVLIFVTLIKLIWRSGMYEEETITTTTETEEKPNIVGSLKRETENEQAFVIDPVDKKKIWLNSNDDMYEDADGKVWRLI